MDRTISTLRMNGHIEDLQQLVARPGPFLTVTEGGAEPAVAKTVEAAVAAVRHAVAETPVAARVDEVAEVVEGAFSVAAGVVVVADAREVLLVEHLEEEPRHTGASYAALPALGPILERRAADLPVVTAMVDRTGADVSWSQPLPGGATAAGGFEVEGDVTHIRKVRGGGWSHRRMQQRAEETWEHTAKDVADEIGQRASAIDARLVVLGGDDRMVDLVRGRLPQATQPLVRLVPGSRSADGSDESRDAVAQRWMRTAVAEDTVEVLSRFAEEKGQLDRAADGVDQTLAALREGRVELLLVHDDPDAGSEAWFVPEDPLLVARNPQELDDLGARDVRVAPAVDVAIRTALLSGAAVRMVPRTPRVTDGMGALLRW